VVTLIEGGDTDRVTSGNETGRSDRGVQKDEGEHAVEHVAEIGSVLLVQVHDDLTVTVGLENVSIRLQALFELLVVVDLPVDAEDDLAVVGDERLRAGVCGRR